MFKLFCSHGRSAGAPLARRRGKPGLARSGQDAGKAAGRTLRMSELAKWAGSSLPRLSQVVARLEQRGWVQRTPDLADGRYTLATLTGQGQAKVTQAVPGHVQEVRRLVFDPLTKAQSRQLREIGRRITRAIDPDDHHPDGGPRPTSAAASAESGARPHRCGVSGRA